MRRRQRRPGLSLIELVASLAVMSIVLGGVTASLMIASRAVDDGNNPRAQLTQNADCLDQLIEELTYAIAITHRSDRMLEFVVADRDADDVNETIRYSWSGTGGDPLTRSYNGAAALIVAENVYAFSLAFHAKEGAPNNPVRVVMVVANSGAMTSAESDTAQLLVSYGFQVSVISDHEAQSLFDSTTQAADVFFVRRSINAAQLGNKLNDSLIGVVNEHADMVKVFKFASNGYATNTTSIDIEDNSHPVTATFSEGLVSLSLLSRSMVLFLGTTAPGAQVLAEYPYSSFPMVAVIESGAALFGGSLATGRRVAIPTSPYSISLLEYTEASGRLMRDALKWAGAPLEITSVDVALQTGSESAWRVETTVETLNHPDARGT
jgi:hypothetical protein